MVSTTYYNQSFGFYDYEYERTRYIKPIHLWRINPVTQLREVQTIRMDEIPKSLIRAGWKRLQPNGKKQVIKNKK